MINIILHYSMNMILIKKIYEVIDEKIFYNFTYFFITIGCSNSSSNSNTTPIKTTVLMYIEGTSFETPEESKTFFEEPVKLGIKTDSLGYGPVNYMIKGMIENLNPENTNIVIQTYSSTPNMAWTDEQITSAGADPSKFYIKDWYDVSRWHITKNGIELLESIGTVCLGATSQNCIDPSGDNVMSDFLTYGVQKYPADRYIVIFSGHGRGTIDGFGEYSIYAEKVNRVFQTTKDNTNVEFDIIGFASCLMGTAEWMHYLSDFGKYYVASEETEPDFPWLLGDITKGIAQNQTTEQLLETITSSYYLYSARNGDIATNISAVDLKQVKKLGTAIDQLSNKIAADYQTNPVKTFNNFYVALSRSDSYADGELGLYDLQAVINSLNETTWYGLDYSSYNQKITDIISDSVKVNKSSPLLSESYGISFYAPNYGQAYAHGQYPLSKYVQLYKTLVPDFSPEYVKMLEIITPYAETETTRKADNFRKDGTNVSIEYTSNFAPSYNSTLELIRTYAGGITRIGTVAGDYTITTADTANSDEIKYTIKVDTGFENINDANLFAVAPYGKEEYNPIRVQIKNSIDSAKPAYSTVTTQFKLTRDNNDYELIAHFLYGKDDETGEFQIINPTFELQTDMPSELQETFTFQKGDIVTIPDYSSEVTAKAANNLPTYQITCESANCLQFDIVPLRAAETPEFRFVIPNIKNETYITPKQTIN